MEDYGCRVFAFDPTMGLKNHNHSKNIYFFNWGLSNKDAVGGWEMRSLSFTYNKLANINKLHGRDQVIDYLKIDIESTEWTVLPNMLESGMLSKIRQIGIEIHLPSHESIQEYRRRVDILRSLEVVGHMVRFDYKYNPWFTGNFTQLAMSGPFCYEIAWYNSKLCCIIEFRLIHL